MSNIKHAKTSTIWDDPQEQVNNDIGKPCLEQRAQLGQVGPVTYQAVHCNDWVWSHFELPLLASLPVQFVSNLTHFRNMIKGYNFCVFAYGQTGDWSWCWHITKTSLRFDIFWFYMTLSTTVDRKREETWNCRHLTERFVQARHYFIYYYKWQSYTHGWLYLAEATVASCLPEFLLWIIAEHL